MTQGRKNTLTKQIGEHLACAELGRRGYLATPFAGNVPEIDLLIADNRQQTLAVQVKTVCKGGSLRMDVKNTIDIEVDHDNKRQIDRGDIAPPRPDLVYVVIELRADENDRDRIYILTQADIWRVTQTSYRQWMERKGWSRPRNYKSTGLLTPGFKFRSIRKQLAAA